VFVRFRNVEGGFLLNNPIDLLHLYNAAHLQTHGEIILDEAIIFTRRRLEMMLPSVEGSFQSTTSLHMRKMLPCMRRYCNLQS
jgi:hypothetical protein